MESIPTLNATNNIATSQQTQKLLNILIMNNLREKLAAAMQHNNPLKLRKFESVTLRFLGEIESSENSQILTFTSTVYGWRAVLIELFRLYDQYKVRTPYHLAFCLYDKISVKAPQIEFAKAVKAQYFHHNSAIGGTLRESASGNICPDVSEKFRPRSISQAKIKVARKRKRTACFFSKTVRFFAKMMHFFLQA